MSRYFGSLFGLALALAALGGCDDHDNAARDVKSDRAGAPVPAGRLGAGWQALSDARLSRWGFAEPARALPGGMLATQSTAGVASTAEAGPADALSAIRAALMTNILPARGAVRIEDLVNRAGLAIEPRGPEGAPGRPRAVLATAPWNDENLLLWVEIPGVAAAGGAAIHIEFDSHSVVAFRPLGDPAQLPVPTMVGGAAGRVAMIYELSLLPVGRPAAAKPSIQYAILHITPPARTGLAGLDQPITTNDLVGTIDNAPDIVRLATAAAGFGELLRGDPAVRDLSCNDMIGLAQSVRRPDPDGWRARLIALMYRAEPLIDLPPAESSR